MIELLGSIDMIDRVPSGFVIVCSIFCEYWIKGGEEESVINKMVEYYRDHKIDE